VFPVTLNNTMPVNSSTDNPSTVHLNISAAAGSAATVYIRFVYYGYAGGSYSWMIDDINLTDVDAVDAGISNAGIVYYSGSATSWNSFGIIPSKMIDSSVVPVTFASNYGYTAEPTTTVNAQIFQGTTNVYTQNVTVGLPVNAVDSLVDFGTVAAGYYSNTKATYTVPFSVNLASDADATNNNDTTRFGISDSTYSENAPGSALTTSYYVHNTTGNASYSPGTSFVITPERTDTLTSVTVAFASGTAVGQQVGVQIYHFDGTAWTYDGVTKYRALTASDISSSSSIAYATFAVDFVASAGYIIMNGGTGGVTYAAVVKGLSNSGNVLVVAGSNPAPASIIGYVGVSDTSYNDGAASQQFGQGGLPGGETSTPLVSLNFGHVPSLAVHNINGNGNFVGAAYPNPANATVTVPFTLKNDAAVTITLSNMIGQVVSTQTIAAVGGVANKASFSTQRLPAGVYAYTVSANGQQTTGRIAITH
jgi:hypothetical protein